MKKRKYGIAILILVLILVLGIITSLILKNKKDDTIPSFEVNSKAYISDIVTGNLFSSIYQTDDMLDTGEVGEYKTILKGKGLFKKLKKEVSYIVVDELPPVFDDVKWFSLVEGDSIDDVRNMLNVYDNSEKAVEIELRGTYDFERPGMYHVTVLARDESGNKKEQEFDMIVEIPGGKPTYFITDEGHYGYEKDGLTFVDGTLIVNKSYSIPANYYTGLSKEALEAFYEMDDDINKEGMDLVIASGHRTHDFQAFLYNNSVGRNGKALADIKTARPGNSEHESGLAMDLNYVDQSFENTREFKWLNENCYKYGFILRYPDGKSDETGYEYEPWHYRYVGEELATKLYNNGNWRTIEEYFGLESQYED